MVRNAQLTNKKTRNVLIMNQLYQLQIPNVHQVSNIQPLDKCLTLYTELSCNKVSSFVSL